MSEEKIKRVNYMYLGLFIFGPIVISCLCFLMSYLFFPDGVGAVILIMGPSFLSIIWWSFVGSFIFKWKIKQFEKELDTQGFSRNHSFYGKGKFLVIDLNKGEIGLLFFWNPFKSYVVSAKKVMNPYVDDGRGGAGFMEGSSRVRFIFTVDDIKIKIDTFTSNQRFRMDSNYIVTGISKADKVVKMLEEAKKNAK